MKPEKFRYSKHPLILYTCAIASSPSGSPPKEKMTFSRGGQGHRNIRNFGGGHRADLSLSKKLCKSYKGGRFGLLK